MKKIMNLTYYYRLAIAKLSTLLFYFLMNRYALAK
nr:MAG TPA: hypothetical protein [Caudoviricetes sp.]DAY69760.1 MAG TPA: hypothetical protein [Caudoviricetes sp.]